MRLLHILAAVVLMILFSVAARAEIYNVGDIDEGSLTKVVNDLKAGEDVILIINSPGGVVSEVFDVLENKTDKSVVSCRIKGEAASAAAILLFACDNIRADRGSTILFHQGFYFIDNEAVRTARSRAQDMLVAYVLGLDKLMTFTEFGLYVQGKDVVIDAKEFIKRMGK